MCRLLLEITGWNILFTVVLWDGWLSLGGWAAKLERDGWLSLGGWVAKLERDGWLSWRGMGG
jgi:hypothetical protein